MSESGKKGSARRGADTESELRDAVEALLAERQRYVDWIAALEARRDEAPQHVYERVHADYGKRLAEVDTRLAAQLPALEGYTGRVEARIQSLEERVKEMRDQRAEAELRALVGELANSEWERQAREHDELIAKVEAEAAQLAQQRERARALLLAATPAAGVTAVAGAPAEPTGKPAEEEAERKSGALDNELEFLRSVAGEGEGAPAAAPEKPVAEKPVAEKPVAEKAADKPAEKPAPAKAIDESRLEEKVAEPAPTTPKPETRPIDPSLGIQVGTGLERADPLAGVNARGSELPGLTGSMPIVLRSENVQARTLKCAECGAMNFPTEWYCEKCGGELATL